MKRILLAVDSAIGSTVSLSDGNTIAVRESLDPMGHAEAIGSLLEEVFAELGISPKSVQAVVSGVGPGPFTGLRVGMAAANAFALGVSKQVLPIVSHDAAAYEIALSMDPGERLRVIQDAKRRELFVTEYEVGADHFPRRIHNPKVVARADLEERQGDYWPERIPGEGLLKVAQRMLDQRQEFPENKALYLRQPDVNLIKPKTEAVK